MKPLITLKPFLHRSGEQIGIYFPNSLPLNIVIKRKAGGKWSTFAGAHILTQSPAAKDLKMPTHYQLPDLRNYEFSYAIEIDSSRYAFACWWSVVATCSAVATASAPARKRNGGFSSFAIITNAFANFAGSPGC